MVNEILHKELAIITPVLCQKRSLDANVEQLARLQFKMFSHVLRNAPRVTQKKHMMPCTSVHFDTEFESENLSLESQTRQTGPWVQKVIAINRRR